MTPATTAAANRPLRQVQPGRLRIQRIAPLAAAESGTHEDAQPDERVQAYRHVLNVTIAAVLFIALLPLMLLIALLVKLSSPGPVIYTQTRVGLDRRRFAPSSQGPDSRRLVDYGGRLFTIYKFRTMAADQGAALQIWAKPNDMRVTKIGRILRKFRLDELPQLLNVIRGEMNIVGPRPEQPNIVLDLREAVDGYQQRHRVLPGITGWAQVNQHYDSCIEDVKRKLQYDLEYINRSSAAEDLRILFRTLPVIIFQKGAL